MNSHAYCDVEPRSKVHSCSKPSQSICFLWPLFLCHYSRLPSFLRELHMQPPSENRTVSQNKTTFHPEKHDLPCLLRLISVTAWSCLLLLSLRSTSTTTISQAWYTVCHRKRKRERYVNLGRHVVTVRQRSRDGRRR